MFLRFVCVCPVCFPDVVGPHSCPAVTDFVCHSGHCLESHLVCDNKADCADGSDETDCGEERISTVTLGPRDLRRSPSHSPASLSLPQSASSTCPAPAISTRVKGGGKTPASCLRAPTMTLTGRSVTGRRHRELALRRTTAPVGTRPASQ